MKILIFLLIILSFSGCNSSIDQAPAKVVKKYFEAWNQKDYATMYSLISEGFKKIEPTANTFENFKNYASNQGVEGVRVNDVNVLDNDGEKASVAYEIEYYINGVWKGFSGTYILKLKDNNWRLIHPYGENIDES